MGNVEGIDAVRFPRQGSHLGERVKVCFRYGLDNWILGTVVRDDMQPPWHTIFRLDDGRHVLATECQYSMTGERVGSGGDAAKTATNHAPTSSPDDETPQNQSLGGTSTDKDE